MAVAQALPVLNSPATRRPVYQKAVMHRMKSTSPAERVRFACQSSCLELSLAGIVLAGLSASSEDTCREPP